MLAAAESDQQRLLTVNGKKKSKQLARKITFSLETPKRFERFSLLELYSDPSSRLP